MVNLVKEFKELDKFVLQMKTKMYLRQDKHNDTLPLKEKDLIYHLIDEILELFQVNEKWQKQQIINILYKENPYNLKQNELPDVANMCWIVDLAIKNDGVIN